GSASDVEASSLGKFETERGAREGESCERKSYDQGERHPQHRRLSPGPFLLLARPEAIGDRTDDPDEKRNLRSAEPIFENRCRQKQATMVNKDAAPDRETIADVRHCLEHPRIPEQQLHQP